MPEEKLLIHLDLKSAANDYVLTDLLESYKYFIVNHYQFLMKTSNLVLRLVYKYTTYEM